MNFRSNPVTIITIALNILVYAILALQQKSWLMMSGADSVAILNAGANFNPLTLDGEPWRIFTCMFLHFGIVHLAVNMYALYNLGTWLEPAIGHTRFAILYVICGLASSLLSLFINTYFNSAGASGAIFGLYGFYLGAEVISTYHDWEKLKNVLINFGIFVVVNTVIGIQASVDHAAHIGGAVAGFIIAVLHVKFQVLRSAGAMGALMVAFPLILFAVPKDQVAYYKIFQRVLDQEQLTNELLTARQDEALRDSLVNAGYEWNHIRLDLKELSRVPADVAQDTATLAQYVQLRIHENNYRIKLLEQSYIYLDSIDVLHARFDSLPPIRRSLNYRIGKKEQQPKPDTTQQQASSLRQVRVFYDNDWKETDNRLEAKYYRIGTRDSLDRWQGRVSDHFINGDIQMKGEYTDGLHDGVFIYYSDHRTYTSAGRYEKERYAGKWETFHWNGKKESETFYDSRTFTRTMWDSLGTEQVSNGNGEYKSWYSNGNLKEEGKYHNGQRRGDFYGYYSNGKPYYREFYENNVLSSGESVGRDGRRFVYDGLSQLPMPVSGMLKYKDYVEKNKRTPLNPRETGTVKVLFMAGTDGSVWDFAILQSVSPFCDREAIRLIREGEKWRPALLHGQEKITSQGYMEVSF